MIKDDYSNIDGFTLSLIESLLEGRISDNPKRFEEANGVVFLAVEIGEHVEDYFRDRGVEIYNLVGNIFYTETVMSYVEFGYMDYVLSYKKVA